METINVDDENTAILVGIDESNTQTEIVIPEKIKWPNEGKTYPVTSLMAKSFWRCSNLTSVKIPSSVTSLGEWCFSGCKSLTSIEIPSSVRSLGMGCFIFYIKPSMVGISSCACAPTHSKRAESKATRRCLVIVVFILFLD